MGNWKYLLMAYTLGNKCAKNLCKRTVLVQLIIEKAVTCFLRHSVEWRRYHVWQRVDDMLSWVVRGKNRCMLWHHPTLVGSIRWHWFYLFSKCLNSEVQNQWNSEIPHSISHRLSILIHNGSAHRTHARNWLSLMGKQKIGGGGL